MTDPKRRTPLQRESDAFRPIHARVSRSHRLLGLDRVRVNDGILRAAVRKSSTPCETAERSIDRDPIAGESSNPIRRCAKRIREYRDSRGKILADTRTVQRGAENTLLPGGSTAWKAIFGDRYRRSRLTIAEGHERTGRSPDQQSLRRGSDRNSRDRKRRPLVP